MQRLLSAEKRDWAIEKDALEGRIALVKQQIESLRAHLAKNDIPISEGEPLDGVARFFAEDPFGNRLEFTESV